MKFLKPEEIEDLIDITIPSDSEASFCGSDDGNSDIEDAIGDISANNSGLQYSFNFFEDIDFSSEVNNINPSTHITLVVLTYIINMLMVLLWTTKWSITLIYLYKQ